MHCPITEYLYCLSHTVSAYTDGWVTCPVNLSLKADLETDYIKIPQNELLETVKFIHTDLSFHSRFSPKAQYTQQTYLKKE